MEDIRLKPCPFCGKDAAYIAHDDWRWVYYAHCPICNFRYTHRTTPEAAAEAWNTRVKKKMRCIQSNI